MALGHPIGATGSMLIGTVLDELERRDLRRGLVTVCAGGGMAPAIIIERIVNQNGDGDQFALCGAIRNFSPVALRL